MRLVLQRVSWASVTVGGETKGEIGQGLLILAGFSSGDDEATCDHLARKAVELRIFDDENGQLNRSLLDIGGGALIVPNFTLYASCRKGRRPSFVGAAPQPVSEPLFHHLVDAFAGQGAARVQCGVFGAEMQVALCNDGPITILLDSDELMAARRQ